MIEHTGIEGSGGQVHWLETASGVRLRVAHWPAPSDAKGTVLLLNGRTEFIEKHLETASDLQARGFQVWTLDWRGQGRSTRLLPDPVPNHVRSFGDHLADLDLVLTRLVAPSLGGRPLVMLAHSMGGHLGVRFLARRPDLFARAVLTTPMIDFRRANRLPRLGTWALTQVAARLPGMSVRFGPGTRQVPDLDRPFADNPLTTCPVRFATDLSWLNRHPELAVGGATWGWLRAATASIAMIHRPFYTRRLRMPVLITVAGSDRLVENTAIRHFARRLRHVTLVEFPGAQHELLREHDRHRDLFWAAFDRFMAPLYQAKTAA